ncbi:hypothetical protein [Mesoterricola sediminis]|uniref:Lipoprotein n=1 Tax=Mesoterricola sediminis TaxID=2927980 RepID=A0AA48GUM1_9BACT|nr:hypothetical protein [Mesoterricola sediminis]BDU77922.1 hypothetical protein METESE_28800 [Mesoterricola sediminis]
MTRPAAALLLTLALAGCGGGRSPVRSQALPSGATVQVLACGLTWGAEHDERLPDQDAFGLEILTTLADPAARDREAAEAFELVRGASEAWGFRSGTVTAYRNLDRRGPFDVYAFTRGAGGAWTWKRLAGRP